MSPVVPWWDVALVPAIVVSSFILDFLFLSVPVFCRTEENNNHQCSYTARALRVCKCIAHWKGFLHLCTFLPCWATCVRCPSLLGCMTLFPSCHRLCASFCTLSSYVCSFVPLVSLRGCSFTVSLLGLQAFLPSVQGPTACFFSSRVLHSSERRGSFTLSNASLLHTIFLFPLDPFLSWRQEWSLAELQCYDP